MRRGEGEGYEQGKTQEVRCLLTYYLLPTSRMEMMSAVRAVSDSTAGW